MTTGEETASVEPMLYNPEYARSVYYVYDSIRVWRICINTTWWSYHNRITTVITTTVMQNHNNIDCVKNCKAQNAMF